MVTVTTIDIYFYQNEQQSTGSNSGCRNSSALVIAPAQQVATVTMNTIILLEKQQSANGDIS